MNTLDRYNKLVECHLISMALYGNTIKLMRDVAYTEDRTERMLAFDAILDNHMKGVKGVQGVMDRMKELEDI